MDNNGQNRYFPNSLPHSWIKFGQKLWVFPVPTWSDQLPETLFIRCKNWLFLFKFNRSYWRCSHRMILIPENKSLVRCYYHGVYPKAFIFAFAHTTFLTRINASEFYRSFAYINLNSLNSLFRLRCVLFWYGLCLFD